MWSNVLPRRLPRVDKRRVPRVCAAHRRWVRSHHCCVPECRRAPIECAHVRSGTGGGVGLKPSDRWVISLCRFHHQEQHELGETRFEARHGISLRDLATLFARRSPNWQKLARMP